jgi:DNA-binding CsgD family transcriptional regulator
MNTPKRKAQIKRQNELALKKRIKQPLSKTEITIIKLIYKEMTSPEIAEKLGKSKRTIENHRLVIIKKIRCKNIIGVIKYALE